jgi:hypothetical protein
MKQRRAATETARREGRPTRRFELYLSLAPQRREA